LRLNFAAKKQREGSLMAFVMMGGKFEDKP